MNSRKFVAFFSVLVAGYSVAWGWAGMNNEIQFRNDSAGTDYFYAQIKPTFIYPQQTYFLQSKSPETWAGSNICHHGGNPSAQINDAIMWAIDIQYSTGDGTTPGTSMELLKNKNIPAGNNISYVACSRTTTGCDNSHHFGNHGSDWDYIVAKKDSILASVGLTDASSDSAKMFAITKWVYDHVAVYHPAYVSNVYNMHPVDFCDTAACCASATGTTCAFGSTMGIPTRLIDQIGHNVAETFVHGQWCYSENGSNVNNIASGYDKGPLYDYSLLEAWADPAAKGYDANCVSFYRQRNCDAPAQASNYLSTSSVGWYLTCSIEPYTSWLFNLGLNAQGKAAPQMPAGRGSWAFNQTINAAYPGQPPMDVFEFGSAYELSALYPQKNGIITYKHYNSTPKMILTNFDALFNNGWWADSVKVNQNQGIRQKFYLSTLTNATAVTSNILFTCGAPSMPANGGNWYYLVNGHKHFLKDNGGWTLQSNYDNHNQQYLSFTIPLSDLSTGAPTATVDNGGNARSATGSDAFHNLKVMNSVASAGSSVQFEGLPPDGVVRIFTISGRLVATIRQSDFGCNAASWNLTNGRAGVVRGSYVYAINDAAGNKKAGNLIVQ